MLEQLRILDEAIANAAKEMNMTTNEYLTQIGIQYTQGDLAYHLLNQLFKAGYKIVKD